MAKKASGKARKKANRKAKETYSYDVGHVPIKGELKLTPDRAREWLECDYEGLQMLATAGLSHSKDEKDLRAFENLAYNVKTMVDACTEALSGESTVTVCSNLGGGPCGDGTYPFSWMFESLRLLRAPWLARYDIEAGVWSDYEFDAFDALVRIVEHYVYAAIKLEGKANQETMRQRNAEKEAGQPTARLDAIHKRRETLEAERNAALEGVTSATNAFLCEVAEPWNLRLDHLKYEEDLVWQEFANCDLEHPGKPPKGYKPQTDPDAAHA